MLQAPQPGEGREAEQGLHPEGHRGVRPGSEGGHREAGGEAEDHRDPTEEDVESYPGRYRSTSMQDTNTDF